MQSTKDTKYIFNNSDKLPYIPYSKFIICLFVFLCVWSLLKASIKNQHQQKSTGNQLFNWTISNIF